MIPTRLLDWLAASYDERCARIDISSNGPSYNEDSTIVDLEIVYTVEVSENHTYSDVMTSTRDYPSSHLTAVAHAETVAEAAGLALDLLDEAFGRSVS